MILPCKEGVMKVHVATAYRVIAIASVLSVCVFAEVQTASPCNLPNAIAGALLLGSAFAQAPSTDASKVDSSAAQTEATALRDAFVTRLRCAGFMCSLAVPAVVIEDVPSFGQYRPETNVVRTSSWNLLNSKEKGFFAQLAGPGKSESDARKLFDAAHQWIFIHELGHWWQACSGGYSKRSHYQVEYGANRIALSYWREVNPQIAETMRPVF
jgi:hypothetical protein